MCDVISEAFAQLLSNLLGRDAVEVALLKDGLDDDAVRGLLLEGYLQRGQ